MHKLCSTAVCLWQVSLNDIGLLRVPRIGMQRGALCVCRKAEEVHIKSVIVRSTYMHREFSKGSLNSIRFYRFKILRL